MKFVAFKKIVSDFMKCEILLNFMINDILWKDVDFMKSCHIL